MSLDFFLDWYCHLFILSLLCQIFLAADSEVINTSCRHSVLNLLSFSSVTNLSLLFGFCGACMVSYRCLQMEWWASGTVVAIPSQPVLLMCPCLTARLSVFSPWDSCAILHSRHPADCILPVLVKKLAVGLIPAISIYKHLLRLDVGLFICRFSSMRLHFDQKRHCSCCFLFRSSSIASGILLSLKYCPSIDFPASCLSMKSAAHVK